MGANSSKSGKGTRKHGRDQVKCARYRAQGRREKNKARRIAKEKKRQEKLRARKLSGQDNSISSEI